MEESKDITAVKIVNDISPRTTKDDTLTNNQETKGFYKLSWLQRIGYGAGDMAQNSIFQTVGTYILFFYTDVYILGGNPLKSAGIAGTMILVVCLIDIMWGPVVGTLIDKNNPRWGKYRSYLILGGIPLIIIAILCFWDHFKPSIIYACITYAALQMCYTLVNVPYGALNASLTRDTDEITILTSTRMVMANLGGLSVNGGVPLVVSLIAKKDLPIRYALFQALGCLPSFIFIPLIPMIKKKFGKKNKKIIFYVFVSIGVFGYASMYIISRMGVNKYVVLIYIAQFIKSSGLAVNGGYMWALIPEVISYGEHKTGRRISGIVNSIIGMFFKAGMALGGAISGWILAGTHYKAAEAASTLPKVSGAWFTTIVIYSLVGLVLLLFCFSQTKERVVMNNKETENVKVSDLWNEFIRNRPLRIISLYFMIHFTSSLSHSSTTAYLMDGLQTQAKSAQEGVRWCVSVIPSILLIINMIVISHYDLSDEKIDKINKEIEEKQVV